MTKKPDMDFALGDLELSKLDEPILLDFFCRKYNLDPNSIKETFSLNGTSFRVVDFETRRPKYPIIATNLEDGKTYKLTADSVRKALAKN